MIDGVDPDNTWIQTTTGKKVSLLNPHPDQIDLIDIVTALRRLSRFTGHGTTLPWTVSRHSCVVARFVSAGGYSRDDIRVALLHDATEAYIGDLSRPLKFALRKLSDHGDSPLDRIEHGLWLAIAERFGLPHVQPESVRWADGYALALEADILFGAGTAATWGLPHPPVKVDLADDMRGMAAVNGLWGI